LKVKLVVFLTLLPALVGAQGMDTLEPNPFVFASTITHCFPNANAAMERIRIQGDVKAIYAKYGAYENDPANIDSYNETTSLLFQSVFATDFSLELPNVYELIIAFDENTPKDQREADLMSAAVWYKARQEAIPFEPTAAYDAAVARYRSSGGISQAELRTYFETNIRALISEAVDREFNTITFVMSGGGKTFNSILTRNIEADDYYLRYEGTGTNNGDNGISAHSLDALLAAMAKSPDFNGACINAVRDNAAAMPAVVFERWKTSLGGNPDCMALIKKMVLDFYLDPTEQRFMLMAQVFGRTIKLSPADELFYTHFMLSFSSVIGTFSMPVSKRIDKVLREKGPTGLSNLPMPAEYSPLWTQP
jgi:hypothetical protein